MSIKSYVNELEQLHAEIKRNNSRNRALRTRVKNLESNIEEYLAQKGQHGVKYKGQAIILERKEHRPAKKKKKKEADVISLLEELGVEDPHKAYTRIQDAQKGDPIEQQKIKFKKLPKF
jgi:cell division septum initiation protein DivIVA